MGVGGFVVGSLGLYCWGCGRVTWCRDCQKAFNESILSMTQQVWGGGGVCVRCCVCLCAYAFVCMHMYTRVHTHARARIHAHQELEKFAGGDGGDEALTEEQREVLKEKEPLLAAIQASHDMHLSKIDAKEDAMTQQQVGGMGGGGGVGGGCVDARADACV